MEANYISKIVYELVRLSDDRNMMFREDDRGLLFREIERLKLVRQNDLKTQSVMSREFEELKEMVNQNINRKSKRSQGKRDASKCVISNTKPIYIENKRSSICSGASTLSTTGNKIIEKMCTDIIEVPVKLESCDKTKTTNGEKRSLLSTSIPLSSKRLKIDDSGATADANVVADVKRVLQDNNSSKPEIKYVATKHDNMRKHDVRAALPGHLCIQCKSYFDTLIQQGMIPDEEMMKEMLQKCSRHKAKYSPPSTPDGYWNLTVQTPPEWK